MKRLVFILSVLTVGTLLAADWPDVPAKKHAFLEVIIANSNSQNIDETGVYIDKHPCTAGIVGAGFSKGYVGWDYPVTTNAIVRWRDPKGIRNEQTVKIVGVYDPKVDGDLTFSIGGTNVTVTFKARPRR